MNELDIQVKLTFSGNLTKEQAQQAVENVLNGLIHTANTAGLTPDDADQFTETISVFNEETNCYLGHDMKTGQSL